MADKYELLPADAPAGHIAHKRVRFDAKDGNRAMFRFKGQHFQTCTTKAGTRHAAEVIARACWMRFEDGEDKDAVTAFRNRCYEVVSSHDAESAKRPRTSRPNDNKEVMQLDMMRYRLGLPATLTELPKLSDREQEQRLEAAASHVKFPSQQTTDSIPEKVSNVDKASSPETANSAAENVANRKVEDEASTTTAEASDATPTKVKASSKVERQASSSEKTKAADATAKPNIEEEETATKKAESDVKPSKTVETVKAASMASDSTSEKTKAADATAKPNIEEEETATKKAESDVKPSKTVETVKAASMASDSTSEKTKAADATAKPNIEEEETATQKAESDVKPSKAVETVKASSKPASSETTTKAADAAAKPNDKEEASKPSQVKASSIASNSASEKTKAADDAAKPSIEEEEAASSQTKSSGSSAKRDKATQKAESNGKRSKAVPSVKAAAKARPAKEAKPKDATAKQKVEKQMPQSSQEAAAASAKGGSRRVECEASAAACGPQTFAYSGSFEADVQKILAGAVLEDSSSKVSTISEDDTPAQAARDTAKKRKAAEKKAQATEEHLESLIERKINLIAVAVVGDLHRNGHIQTVLVAEVEKGRASVFVSEDLLKGSKAQAALKVLLEAKEVVKVMHDCRMAADALQSLLDIQLCSVFDTAIAWQMLQDTDPSASSSTESTILPVLQKYAPLAFKEMHKVLPPQKKTLPKPEQAIFDVLGLRDEVTSTAIAVEKHEEMSFPYGHQTP
ncbi:hypothetical protein AK812_SmicGene21049 [Symbiodinium microadriaticum]|uniref:3'-5' exonuclease domain-containing protein n=1 Tax=Symbiodinium microadriaticum TaxID=2951 RepID=A0A1Q9DNE4_SYMMI|nr:hypothetical protein AK812_SmicGene21049 [Symbiodinium microadriaticum]